MFTLATSNARTIFPLSSKKVIKKTISKALVLPWVFVVISLFFAPMVSVLTNYLGANTLPILVSAVVLLYLVNIIFTYVYEGWYFETYYYELTEGFVLIRKGVISNKEITIPFNRIQDVYVDQDVLDRMFGIYDVHLSSATISSTWLAHIDGLEKEAADGLKQALLLKLHDNESNNGVKTAG